MTVVLIFALGLPLTVFAAELSGTFELRIQTVDGVLIPHAAVTMTQMGQTSFFYPDVGLGLMSLPLAPGTYRFSVSAVGYQPADEQIVKVEANKSQTVTFVLKPATAVGKVSGVVIDKQTGSGQAMIPVTLEQDGKPLGGAIKTGGDGAFVFDRVPPGTYTVAAGEVMRPDQPGGFTRDTKEVTVTAGAESKVDLAVLRRGQIRADVWTPGGGAARGVQLSAIGAGHRVEAWPGLVGSPPGDLSVWLPPGEYAVTVVAPAYREIPGQTATVLPGQTVHLAFTATPLPAGAIRGKLVNTAGAPIARGVVVLSDGQGRSVGQGVQVGADGRFAIEPVAVGTHWVHAVAPGYAPGNVLVLAPGSDPVASVKVEEGQTAIADLTLKRQVELTVRVVGPDGTVLPGAYLMRSGTRLRTGTDEEGNLLLTAEEGDWPIAAAAPGYWLSPTQTIKVGPTGDLPTLTFILSPRPTETLTGVAVHARSGDPVANLHVELRMIGGVLRAADPVRTGADGRFTFSEVPPGTYELHGWGEGANVGPVYVTVTGAAVVRVNLLVEPLGQLKVRVIDVMGRPVPHASVFTSQAGGGQWSVYTDGAGLATLTLGAGSYQVTARAAGHAVITAKVVQLEDRKPAAVVLMLAPVETGAAELRVEDATTGEGVSGVLVALTDPANPARGAAAARTDAYGIARYFDLPVGEYDVTLKGRAGLRITVTAGETVQAVLKD